MSNNNKLYRNFIILQEDERGYANSSDKTLSGYSKIEARGERCKISFYAQNLRKDNDKYYMMLICCKKDMKQLVNLGPLEVSDSGKGEVTKEYDTSNIGGVNISYDKVSGATICKVKEGIPIYVMYGFLNGEQPSENWKNYKTIMGTDAKAKFVEKIVKKSDKKDEKKEEKYEKKYDKYEKKEDKCEDKEDKKDYKKHDKDKCEERDEFKNTIEIEKDFKQSIEEEINQKVVNNQDQEQYIVSNPYESKENLRGKFEDYEEEIELSKDHSSSSFKIRGSIGSYFESIAEGFELDRDGFEDIKYCKWYKIPIHDLYEMSNISNYNKYTLAYYPMLNYYPYIKKYGYFMLGYKCDPEGNLKYIVYAVPGRRDKDEQPYDGRTGFVTWVSKNDTDKVGCWLMFYDFKNSNIVVPMQ